MQPALDRGGTAQPDRRHHRAEGAPGGPRAQEGTAGAPDPPGDWHQVLVFTRMKHGANRLTDYLNEQGITAMAIHGNKSQTARTKALADFKSGDLQVLVATDIAARGIDIDQLPHVVNFELPNVPEDYVHRIGRTGRAGAHGRGDQRWCAWTKTSSCATSSAHQAQHPARGGARLRAAGRREGRAHRAGPHDHRHRRHAAQCGGGGGGAGAAAAMPVAAAVAAVVPSGRPAGGGAGGGGRPAGPSGGGGRPGGGRPAASRGGPPKR
jgi:ATP-dependent RNA helicase RhlE